MSTLRITRQADRDLEAIWAYIAQDSLRHADEMLDRLSEKFWKLVEVPGIGPPCFDIADGLHHFPVGKYNIYYVLIEDGVADKYLVRRSKTSKPSSLAKRTPKFN